MCSNNRNSDVKEIDSVLQLDHQSIKFVGGNYDLTHQKHRVVSRGSKYFTGFLSSDRTTDLLVTSDGLLTFGGHKVRVKMYRSDLQHQTEWVDNFKWDKTGIVYIDGTDLQIRELRRSLNISYPKVSKVLGFAATETHIFVANGSDSGCQLTQLVRINSPFSRTRDIVAFSSNQFECMQANKNYLLVCFRSQLGDTTLVSGYIDHHLHLYSASDLSFMQVLTFSSCGFLPRRLHTKNTWKFLKKHNQWKKIPHVPHWPPEKDYPDSLSDSEADQLSYRSIPRNSYDLDAHIREIQIFPYEGDERNLVVALRDKAQSLFLFGIGDARLTQFEGLRMFTRTDGPKVQQFRILPRPDLKGVIAISDTCIVENISLTNYTVSY